MTTQTMGDMKSQGTSYWIPLMCTANVIDRPSIVSFRRGRLGRGRSLVG